MKKDWSLSQPGMLGGAKLWHDISVDLDAAIEIAVRSKKPTSVALEVNYLTKKGLEKTQEEHQQ